MTDLKELKCAPCRGGEPPLSSEEISRLASSVPAWHVEEQEGIKRLVRAYKMRDFAGALAFANKVGALAEQEAHHPAILTEYGQVTITWWTHKIGGIHKNDFIMAAKTDALFGAR